MVHLLAAALAVSQAAAPPDFSFLDRTPIRVSAARIVGESAVLGRPADGVVGSDGRVCVADMSNGRITCLTASGEFLWQAGRAGAGPGEFRQLYRLAMAADDGVLAYDRGLNRLSRFSASGSFVASWTLPVSFSQVLSVMTFGDGVLLSGTRGGGPSNHGVHHFRIRGPRLEVVRSFGALPAASHPRLVASWGSGMLAPTPDGGVLYSLRIPYEITRYDHQLRASWTIRPDVLAPARLDEVLQIRDQPGGGTSYHVLDVPFAVPAMLHLLTPTVILSNRSRVRGNGTWWDFITVPGGATVPVQVPERLGIWQIFGSDLARGLLWAFGEDGTGAPVVWRLEFRMR